MYAGRRIAVLRITALAALAVSAILVGDGLHPGRAFCPLAAACEKARSSALGNIFGVPTSVVGMAAFGGLFFLSMLRVEISRSLLRPAGFMAAVVGAGLFGYQALVIRSFCPLCLVADTAGLVAGLVVLTWPKTPIRRSGKKMPAETLVSRLRWMTAAAVVVAAPFLWPRPEKPSWIAIPEGAGTDIAAFDVPDAPAAAAVAPAQPGNAYPAEPAMPAGPPDVASPGDRLPSAPPLPSSAPTPPAPRPASAPPAAALPPPPPPRADLTIVEYLNAFCSHCRATHERLDRVLTRDGIVARRRRIYTWSSNDVPEWARAVAFAQTQGLEDRMFAELVHADEETTREIFAAAERAGVDGVGLRAALADRRIPPRLESDRRSFQGARLEGLPTLDIGRRRLMGEQSEDELREAVRAALPRPEPSR